MVFLIDRGSCYRYPNNMTPPNLTPEEKTSLFQESVKLLRQKGVDVDRLLPLAARNLMHWKENPAVWDPHGMDDYSDD